MKNTHFSATCLICFGLASFLGGCANQSFSNDATFDRIQGEIKAAGTKATTPAPAPSNQPAQAAPVAAAPRLPEPPEPRFDLAVNNTPAPQVFTAIVSGTPYSMLVPADLAGNVTVNLKKVTLREALDTLRDLYGYEYRVQGKRIMILPNTLQIKVFKVNYLAGKRHGVTDMRVTSGAITTNQGTSNSNSGTSSNSGGSSTPSSGGTTSQRGSDSSRIYTTQDSDFWSEIQTSLKLIVGAEEGRSVVINPITGIVVVKAFPPEMRQVDDYLKASQVVLERQVMLEAKIIQVQLSSGFQTGINWNYFRSGDNSRLALGVNQPGSTLASNGTLSAGGNTLQPGSGGSVTTSDASKGFFGIAFQAANFVSLLNFLETQGNVQVLSSPRIATLNNQKAVLKVGTDDYFVTNVSTTTNTSGTNTVTSPSITVQPFFSGIALDVTPQIDEGGHINLHVHPSISVVSEKNKNINLGQLGSFVLPLASSNVNETDAIVRVKDGQIVAIGGLMKQSQSDDRSQFPGLGDVPVLGTLFGQRAKSVSKEEIVILIKPTVIRDDWQGGLDDLQERMPDFKPGSAVR